MHFSKCNIYISFLNYFPQYVHKAKFPNIINVLCISSSATTKNQIFNIPYAIYTNG